VSPRARRLGVRPRLQLGASARPLNFAVRAHDKQGRDPYWLICFLSFLFMIPVQVTATHINEAVAPGYDRNERFTWKNWVTVVVGGLVVVLVIIATFLPEP